MDTVGAKVKELDFILLVLRSFCRVLHSEFCYVFYIVKRSFFLHCGKLIESRQE